MTYVMGILLHTSSSLPNTIFISPSNFSSSPTDYKLAIGCYNITTDSGSDVNIQSIIANQTSQFPGVYMII